LREEFEGVTKMGNEMVFEEELKEGFASQKLRKE